jgi:hypothetical protein
MAGLDEVMERLLADEEFRRRLVADPAGALAGYTLDDSDREVLAATLTDDEGTPGAVERRTTQSSVAGLLSAFDGVLDAAGSAGSPDRAVPWTAIAQAESGGETSR